MHKALHTLLRHGLLSRCIIINVLEHCLRPEGVLQACVRKTEKHAISNQSGRAECTASMQTAIDGDDRANTVGQGGFQVTNSRGDGGCGGGGWRVALHHGPVAPKWSDTSDASEDDERKCWVVTASIKTGNHSWVMMECWK